MGVPAKAGGGKVEKSDVGSGLEFFQLKLAFSADPKATEQQLFPLSLVDEAMFLSRRDLVNQPQALG